MLELSRHWWNANLTVVQSENSSGTVVLLAQVGRVQPADSGRGKKPAVLKSDPTVFLSLTVCVQRVAVNVSTGQNYCRVGNTYTTGIFPFRSKFF